MKKTTYFKRVLVMMLIVAMAFSTVACNTAKKGNDNVNVSEESNVLGEGQKTFHFTVADGEGNEKSFEIHTDKTTVGEALVELGLIEGEVSQYGLYVKTVNGITADYDKDGVYWAFYVNGEYATCGVDAMEITDGDTYAFKVEK